MNAQVSELQRNTQHIQCVHREQNADYHSYNATGKFVGLHNLITNLGTTALQQHCGLSRTC